MLYTYSIMPLLEDSFDEIVIDIKEQVERGVSIMPLFKFVPIAEGTPLWDKIGPMCELYAKYRDALAKYNIKTGVLLQASLGHGWVLEKSPFQRYINLTDGKEANSYCPENKDFLEHLCYIMEKIAKENPSVIMLDDDFRLTRRGGGGCACPAHMKKFNDATGLNMTREQLFEHIETHTMDDEINKTFLEIQHSTLIETAKELRETVDRINPAIQGAVCATGDECNIPMVQIAKIFAGKGNPSIVRAHNGIYAPLTDREHLTQVMFLGAAAVKFFKSHGIDIMLAEADTIPFNRYAKSARFLHSQFTCSILEGMTGAKHWFTRFAAGEIKSGRAYREILAKHNNFYEKLAELAKDVKWVGVNQMICPMTYNWYKRRGTYWSYLDYYWTKLVFERMGIPVYFDYEPGNATLLEGVLANNLTEEQIEKIFEKTVLMTSSVAQVLNKRGFGKYIGVDVSEEMLIGGNEVFDMNVERFCTKQKNAKNLIPSSDNVEVLSHTYIRKGQTGGEFYPAVTRCKNEKGGNTIVYCGTPEAEFKYTEGFAFLNETRKKQFIYILKAANALPIYVDGDEEILLRAGVVADGRMLAAIINLGFDPADEINLYLENEPKKISMLMPNGEEKEVSFEKQENNIYKIDAKAEQLYPTILLIK